MPELFFSYTANVTSQTYFTPAIQTNGKDEKRNTNFKENKISYSNQNWKYLRCCNVYAEKCDSVDVVASKTRNRRNTKLLVI